MQHGALPFSDACERNKGPILDVLSEAFSDRSSVLEVGSGTGQHAVFFAAHLPHLVWQPTERQVHLSALAARIAAEGGANLRAPLELEVCRTEWDQAPVQPKVDAVYTANTLHIMSWPEAQALLSLAGGILPVGGVLCIYGPFLDSRQPTAPSNGEFDRMLRERDPASGLRSLDEVVAHAGAHDLDLTAAHALPAHNRALVFLKRS